MPTAAADAADTAPRPGEYPVDTLLGGRYRVEAVAGRGASAVTYRCADAESDSGARVAVKALSLRAARGWKGLELFERETATLRALDHPGVPRFLDSFEVDSDADRAFFLVQELVEGETLAAAVAAERRGDDAEVARVAGALLDVLRYLGSRRPPVVHRDVTPSNIVVEGGRPGGRVFLVDFGGAAAAAAAAADEGVPGSTVVGTYGFMAPEQFRGAATPASDLYALGATLLFLATGRAPAAFPLDRLRVDLSSAALAPRLRAVVEGLLEPDAADRLSADEAAALLAGGGAPRPRGAAVGGSLFGGRRAAAERGAPRRPAGTRVRVSRRGATLEVDIPPARLDAEALSTGSFALVWNAFVAVWTVSALAGGGLLFALFSVPFWIAGAGMGRQALARQLVRESLEVGPRRWRLRQALALARAGGAPDWGAGRAAKEVAGATADLDSAAVEIKGYVNGEPRGQLALRQGVDAVVFGEALDPLEQEWLAGVVDGHLAELAAMRGGELDEADGGALGGGYLEANDNGAGADDGVPFNMSGGAAGASGRLYDAYAESELDDRRLGGEAAAAAAAAARAEGARAAEAARVAGRRAAADAAAAAAEAEARAAAAAAAARRAAKRRAGGGDGLERSASGTIELGSGDYDVLDD